MMMGTSNLRGSWISLSGSQRETIMCGGMWTAAHLSLKLISSGSNFSTKEWISRLFARLRAQMRTMMLSSGFRSSEQAPADCFVIARPVLRRGPCNTVQNKTKHEQALCYGIRKSSSSSSSSSSSFEGVCSQLTSSWPPARVGEVPSCSPWTRSPGSGGIRGIHGWVHFYVFWHKNYENENRKSKKQLLLCVFIVFVADCSFSLYFTIETASFFTPEPLLSPSRWDPVMEYFLSALGVDDNENENRTSKK